MRVALRAGHGIRIEVDEVQPAGDVDLTPNHEHGRVGSPFAPPTEQRALGRVGVHRVGETAGMLLIGGRVQEEHARRRHPPRTSRIDGDVHPGPFACTESRSLADRAGGQR